MNKTIMLWLASALATAGCLGLEGVKPEALPPPAPARPAAPVTVDRVNPGNAHQMVDALRQELDQENQ